MPRAITQGAAAAATAGQGIYRASIPFSKAVATYVVNETNFPGITPFLPGPVIITANTLANITISIADSTGTDRASAASGVFMVFVDPALASGTGGCVKVIVVTGTTTVNFMFPAW